jgi:hypothetical protein
VLDRLPAVFAPTQTAARYFCKTRLHGIESRRSEDMAEGRHLVFDDKCKIVPLSFYAASIVEGIVSHSDQRRDMFDGFNEALEAYQKAMPAGSLENAPPGRGVDPGKRSGPRLDQDIAVRLKAPSWRAA